MPPVFYLCKRRIKARSHIALIANQVESPQAQIDSEEEEDLFDDEARLPRLYPRHNEVREEDFELLMEANEKLRRRNAHLRKVINVLLDS